MSKADLLLAPTLILIVEISGMGNQPKGVWYTPWYTHGNTFLTDRLSASTIASINHCIYQPLYVSTIASINHCIYQPLHLSTIASINHRIYQPLHLSTIASTIVSTIVSTAASTITTEELSNQCIVGIHFVLYNIGLAHRLKGTFIALSCFHERLHIF